MAEASITVAVCTYRRSQELTRLLRALSSQRVSTMARVLVVDNDADGSAQPVVRAELPEASYVCEPRPGIAAARAAALEQSVNFDLLAFIDDDEIPQGGWLSALVETWQRTRAAAVAGQVYTDLSDAEPRLQAMDFMARPVHPTGTALSAASTNNLLLDLRQIRDSGLQFDGSLGTAGGEDTLFSRQLVRRGYTIVACAESLVLSPLPPDRATWAWARQRAFSHGNAEVIVSLRLADGPVERTGVRVRWSLAGVGRIVFGLLRAAAGDITRRPRSSTRGRRSINRGRGILHGVFGRHYREYSR